MGEDEIVIAESINNTLPANDVVESTIEHAQAEIPLPTNGLQEGDQNDTGSGPVEIKTEAESEDVSSAATRKRKHDSITKSASASRHSSPPWKKFAADGPTSFTSNGVRRSARTNTLPIELQTPSDHRRTRAEAKKGKPRPSYATLHSGVATEKKPGVQKVARVQKPKATVKAEGDFKVPSAKSARTRRQSESAQGTPTKRRRSSAATYDDVSSPTNSFDVNPTSRTSRMPSRHLPGQTPPQTNGHTNVFHSASSTDQSSTPMRFQRLRLRIREPIMPKTHPSHFPPPRKHNSFKDWLDRDDPLEGEEKERMDEEQAKKEANIRLRILKAAEPGGPLSAERCSKHVPGEWQEPQPRYGHINYVAAHAARFQKLMAQEHERHVKQAKQVAIACQTAINTVERWSFLREAKSAEQIWAEKRGYQIKRYRQLVKDLEMRWAFARNEVNQIRLKKWEEEQEALGQQALDEMFDNAKAILTQNPGADSSIAPSDNEDMESFADGETRGSHTDTEAATSGDESGSGEASESEIDDENMSESSDEEEAGGAPDEDENLSPEALQAKYAHLLARERAASEGSEDEDGTSELEQNEESQLEQEDEEDNPEDEDVVMNGTMEHGDEGESVPPENDEPSIHDGNATSAAEKPQTDELELQDYRPPELEEVDEALLDSDDASTDMSSDMGSDDDGSGGVEASGSSSDDDKADSFSMLGFFSTKDLQSLKKQHSADDAAQEVNQPEAEEPQTNGVDADLGEPEPYPMEADELTTESKKPPTVETQKPSTLDSTDASQSRRVSNSLSVPATPTSEGTSMSRSKVDIPTQLLRGTLRIYQHDGLDWLAKLYAGGRNGILADEMGLGKTIQTIALLAHLAVHHEVWGPHLVVVPTSVILNWEMEFKKWCPGFKILTYYGTQEERKRKRQGWLDDDKWNVCITSYQLILQDAAAFKKRSWHYLILDEAHNIKNFQTQRWQTLLTFKTHSRLLLTGTPLQNNLQELWSLLYFLMPAGTDGAGGFADLEKFLNSMKRPADQILDQGKQKLDAEAQARVNKLHEVLRPYLLRRLKSEVEKQMPAKYEHVVYCRLSKRQRQLYDEFMGRADTKRTLSSGNYMSIINCLMSLRKVCNHPDLFETRQIVTSFAMPKSAVADYEIKELLVRRRLLADEKVDLDFCGLIPVNFEWNTRRRATRIHELQPLRPFLDLVERQTRRLKPVSKYCSSIESSTSHVEATAQRLVLRKLENGLQHVRRSTQRWPLNGADLVNMLTMPDRFKPKFPSRWEQRIEGPRGCTPGEWHLKRCNALTELMPTLPDVAKKSEVLVQKFSSVTPAVVAEDVLPLSLTRSGQELIQTTKDLIPSDPYHEARIRLSIQFPDKRLLQYDCGKLQALDKLLRELQAGGHRCLIFTQMTKVLDILEQFLNIHGHRYLRLDGATKIENRQILTDRFNSDTRILAFILSSRSGGLGINLTGADTVIFYDLDWNPAMDAQCQDRAHRIGQTRDVHIYRFVSEYTIEANILRKSNQKRLLDDVIIQKGEFTTDYFNRVTYRDAFADDDMQGDAEASAAMDKILGDSAGLGKVLDAVEDKEDVAAAKVAQKEMSHIDDDDFNDTPAAANTPKASTPQTPGADAAKGAPSGPDAVMEEADKEKQQVLDEEVELPHVDEYMVRFLQEELKNVPVVPPGGLARRKKSKKATSDWKRGR
jgi:helicase SWR1